MPDNVTKFHQAVWLELYKLHTHLVSAASAKNAIDRTNEVYTAMVNKAQ